MPREAVITLRVRAATMLSVCAMIIISPVPLRRSDYEVFIFTCMSYYCGVRVIELYYRHYVKLTTFKKSATVKR